MWHVQPFSAPLRRVCASLLQMGISLLSCYHGAQIFEIYGLGKEVVDLAFFGSVSRIGGLNLADVQRESESFWVKVSCSSKLHMIPTGSNIRLCYSVSALTLCLEP